MTQQLICLIGGFIFGCWFIGGLWGRSYYKKRALGYPNSLPLTNDNLRQFLKQEVWFIGYGGVKRGNLVQYIYQASGCTAYSLGEPFYESEELATAALALQLLQQERDLRKQRERL